MKEPDLYLPQNTIAVIQKYQFAFQKKFGQNFLIDGHVLQKIIAAANITGDDVVLEIGPGIGTLTQFLAASAGKVVAVEIDRNLLPILEETLCGFSNVTVLHADIMKTDVHDLVNRYCEGRPIKVVANLPYYITTPIIMGLFESHVPLQSMTVMVQKEVAQRMQQAPGSKDYGALSLAVQYYAQPYLAANVPPNCFMPRPKVGSAVVHLNVHRHPPVPVRDEALMFRLIRASFNQRRKTLVNGLLNGAGLSVPRAELMQIIEELTGDPNVRGETLSLQQFAALSDRISERQGHDQGGLRGEQTETDGR